MDHFLTVCVNLDKRDSKGKPQIIKTPKEPILIYETDSVHWTISIIEHGAETDLGTVNLWNETVKIKEAPLH